ncbi:MAG: hypothetical protein QGH46_00505, partial [Gammaproteobacteria bacterium]|nr:hypothetical protein [Gammaproteobacteria bacterium]
TFFLERVQFAEASTDFKDAFIKSIRRRKLDESSVEGFLEARKATSNDLKEWRESLTGDDIKTMRVAEEVSEIFKEIRRRGYRTPHKA